MVDTPDLWAFYRNRVGDGKQHLVLVGASRIRLGFVPEVFRSHNPGWKVTNLAVDAKHPVATLRDLAEDDDFRGTVLCSINEGGIDSHGWDDQEAYVEHTKQASLVGPITGFVKAKTLQRKSVVFGQQLNWKSLLGRAIQRKPLVAPPVETMPDRTGRARYPEKLKPMVADIAPPSTTNNVDPQLWKQDARSVAALAEKIEERGGRVVFVRYPETGERFAEVRTKYPKSKFWTYFASIAQCPAIHFEDFPELSQFELPDDSHLNFDDAVEFTQQLVQLVFDTMPEDE